MTPQTQTPPAGLAHPRYGSPNQGRERITKWLATDTSMCGWPRFLRPSYDRSSASRVRRRSQSIRVPKRSASGFEPTLPDCRAYEQVTPTFQDGANDVGITAISADGDALIGSSLAGFAGAESNTIGPTYRVQAHPWGVEHDLYSPSAAVYPTSEFLTMDANLDASAWVLRTGGQSIYTRDIYRRDSEGHFTEIGPMVPPAAQTGPPAEGLQQFLGAYRFAGASSDLSHVYFQILHGLENSALWPGDTTRSFPIPRGESLYEYTGEGNRQPSLVGVNGEGHLISDCATFLGAIEGADVYNAVSNDGSRAYFTAEGHSSEACKPEVDAPEVNEVWARVNGIESVPISEPAPVDCEACRTAERAPAEFAGASESGRQVFFTSAQSLLPGAETENLYEYDFNAPRGKRVSQISAGPTPAEVLGVSRVSEDGSHVYFVARGKLTDEPRGGAGGSCLADETILEREAEAQTHEGRCRAKAGKPNLYLFERTPERPGGRLVFVATLVEGDESDWITVDNRPSQTTPDGRYLVIQSGGALTNETTSEAPQVYEYDAQSEELVWVSRGSSSYPEGTTNADGSYAVITSQGYQLQDSQPARPRSAASR